MNFKKLSDEIEDEHYCGKRPMSVRLASRIESALRSAYAEGLEDALTLLKEAKTMLIISGYATKKPSQATDYLNWSNKVENLYLLKDCAVAVDAGSVEELDKHLAEVCKPLQPECEVANGK